MSGVVGTVKERDGSGLKRTGSLLSTASLSSLQASKSSSMESLESSMSTTESTAGIESVCTCLSRCLANLLYNYTCVILL